MKIAILGTRGIPNTYGGFEQNAENLAREFVRTGHSVTVYSPREHPYKHTQWHGVAIQRIPACEHRLGVLGTAVYDFLCLAHAVRGGYDVILELGYGPSGLFFPLRRLGGAALVTNMDGLEWTRAKWGRLARLVWLMAERRAVTSSDALVADNPGIQRYLAAKFAVGSTYVGHGAEIRRSPDCAQGPEKLGMRAYAYDLVIARLEPENNLEMILDGVRRGDCEVPLVIVGNANTRYGRHLRRKYADLSIVRFAGGLYDYDLLAALRYHARRYFHGHSVGGTNPSLLEAMACGANVCAHDNEFNRYVVGNGGAFFADAGDVAAIRATAVTAQDRNRVRETNWERLAREFNWPRAARAYLAVFEQAIRDTRPCKPRSGVN